MGRRFGARSLLPTLRDNFAPRRTYLILTPLGVHRGVRSRPETSLNEAERHRLPGVISRQLQTCLRVFRPEDTRLAKVYDHVVESDLLGVLLAPRMSEQEGVTTGEWHRASREAAAELVRDYVDENYTERELEEIRARIAHAMMSLGMEEEERERLLDGLEEELGED